MERSGRRSRFTADGDLLLGHARQILALHDEALRAFDVADDETVVIGSTEHAAAQPLPRLTAVLGTALPGHRVRYRLDRGTALRDALGAGRIDLALLLGATDDPRAEPVGELDLTWYCAPGWTRPDGPVPLVAFDNPCALRTRALETLSAYGIPAEIGAEANQLAGVHAAAAAGQGVALSRPSAPPPRASSNATTFPRPSHSPSPAGAATASTPPCRATPSAPCAGCPPAPATASSSALPAVPWCPPRSAPSTGL
ncbi:LysR substrate-binding domain-containing protein [Amycolatopsis sp. NPDC049253]|uniref:LysR substrate-binding domain-containing protein n=1 Tax=Amycolatopsis sp. NPDC049253 TaxID=3155274 RepID=UPI0034401E53